MQQPKHRLNMFLVIGKRGYQGPIWQSWGKLQPWVVLVVSLGEFPLSIAYISHAQLHLMNCKKHMMSPIKMATCISPYVNSVLTQTLINLVDAWHDTGGSPFPQERKKLCNLLIQKHIIQTVIPSTGDRGRGTQSTQCTFTGQRHGLTLIGALLFHKRGRSCVTYFKIQKPIAQRCNLWLPRALWNNEWYFSPGGIIGCP